MCGARIISPADWPSPKSIVNNTCLKNIYFFFKSDGQLRVLSGEIIEFSLKSIKTYTRKFTESVRALPFKYRRLLLSFLAESGIIFQKADRSFGTFRLLD